MLSFSDMFSISACRSYLDNLTSVVGSYCSTFFCAVIGDFLCNCGILLFHVAYFSCLVFKWANPRCVRNNHK